MKLKFISAILACMAVATLTACNAEEAQTSATTQGQTAEVTTEEAFVMPDFSDKEDVLSINGRNVSYEEYRYYFLNVKETYDRGDSTYWEHNDYDDEIKAEVMDYLLRQYAVEDLAAQYGIKLEKEDYDEIDSMIASNKNEFATDNEYNKYLDYLNLTDDANYRLATVYMLEEKLFEYLKSEESDYIIHYDESLVDNFFENYVVHGDWILIYNDYGDDKNENKTLLQRICTMLDEGGDFAKLKASYSEDQNTKANSNGQYMRDGQYNKIIESTVKSLEVGKRSEIIELPYGYLLVKRLDMNKEYIKENFSAEILPYYQESMFEIMLDKVTADVKYFDVYESLTVDSVE